MNGQSQAGSFNLLPLDTGGALLLSAHPASLPGWDLNRAVAEYAALGAQGLLSLTTQSELLALDLGALSLTCRAQGMQWWHAPIEDLQAPDQAFEGWWHEYRLDLHRLIDEGRVLALHCWSGYGRSGTVAAKLLVERGMSPGQALDFVRLHRNGAVETDAQVQYVLGLSSQP